MPTFGSIENAVAAGRRRVVPQGHFRGCVDTLFESDPGEALGPQAFLVHMEPHLELPLHFHMQHQVQVVVDGGGTLGRHALQPGTVHYASPQAAYGPLVAGAQGMKYFTLRVLTDQGAWYLPKSRIMMERGIFKEQFTGTMASGAQAPGVREILPLRADGLGAWGYAANAGGVVLDHRPVAGAGRFYVVLAGSFRTSTVVMRRFACAYQAPGEATPLFEALEPASGLIVVQFPAQALLNEVPPERRVAPREFAVP